MALEMYEKAIKGYGFEVIDRGETTLGTKFFRAHLQVTEYKDMTITCAENGNIHVIKPNGSRKTYYEKTPGQLHAIVRQTIDFYI